MFRNYCQNQVRQFGRTERKNDDESYYFKYSQQDATLYNILYYCQCSTCSLLAATASGSSKQA